MAIKDFLDEIEEDVKDMKNKNFDYSSTEDVPSRHDGSLNFESGKDKNGKILNSCVLYVDIRNSVELNRIHHTQTMGRIYSIFSKSMLKIAKHHNGSVRNIIGDRVMIVFPSDNCFTNAVDCAITIYHVSKYLINKVFTGVDFKCGIGIDYGELKVVKVGIRRQGTENFDNKNLVWVGYPANIASRLTDVANKEVNNTKIKVTYYPYNFRGFGSFGKFESIFDYTPYSSDKTYKDYKTTKLHDYDDFAKCLIFTEGLGITYSGGKLEKFETIENKIKYPPILMSEAVFKGFKAANSERSSIKENYWEEVSNEGIKDVTLKIYGGTVTWKI
jgi:class 3 adenylate cyclase